MTEHRGATIGAAPQVVKNLPEVYDAGMPKECPMCGEFMRLVTKEHVSRLPGTSQEVKATVKEWICPECDYFEEAEGSDS